MKQYKIKVVLLSNKNTSKRMRKHLGGQLKLSLESSKRQKGKIIFKSETLRNLEPTEPSFLIRVRAIK